MSEEIFGDEGDVSFGAKFGGTLSFSEQSHKPSEGHSSNVRSWSKISRGCATKDEQVKSPDKPKKVIFDVISAHIVNNPGLKKYVSYTILIKTSPGLDNCPAVIERRYSDFLLLYQHLRKTHLSFIQELNFPKKAVLGNFTADVITERSDSFHSILTYINSTKELKNSRQFCEFLHVKEIRAAQKLMMQRMFDDAVTLLENAVFLQEKFVAEYNCQTFWTISLLVACLNEADNLVEAQKYTVKALTHTENEEHHKSPIYLPLLQLSIHLCWSLGMDKKHLEKRLADYQLKSPDCCSKSSTLLEAVCQQFPF